MLFADVRGPTALAERISPHELSSLMARFYGAAAQVVDGSEGIVDKFVGDEVMALFIPGFSGREHAARSVATARQLLEAKDNDKPIPGSHSVRRYTRTSPTWEQLARATPGTSPRLAIQ